jgi:putative spermidine/putrescine transport system permease protein
MMGNMRLLRAYVYLCGAFMLAPILITVPVAVTTTGYMTFPPVGFTLSWFFTCFQDRILVESLIRSVNLALLAAALSVAVGLLSAFAIERGEFRGKAAIETLFSGPQMIPQIIFVLALLIFYERIGLNETFGGLLVSHVLMCLPFSFRTLLVSVGSLDRRMEWSAQILGATTLQTFLRIILPQIKTGMIASAIFTFILSFNNVTFALFLAGVGKKTLPVEMFQRLHVGGITPAIPAISFLLTVFGVVLFFVADRTVGVYRYLGGSGTE